MSAHTLGWTSKTRGNASYLGWLAEVNIPENSFSVFSSIYGIGFSLVSGISQSHSIESKIKPSFSVMNNLDEVGVSVEGAININGEGVLDEMSATSSFYSYIFSDNTSLLSEISSSGVSISDKIKSSAALENKISTASQSLKTEITESGVAVRSDLR